MLPSRQSCQSTWQQVTPQDELLTLIASILQLQTMTTITDQGMVHIFESTSVATNAKKEAAVAAEDILVH